MNNISQASFWLTIISVCWLPFSIEAGEQMTERQFQIPGHGVLKLNVPESWVDEVNQPPNDLPPTIVISPSSGGAFKILITAMWSPKKEDNFNKPPEVKHLMEQRGKELLPTAEETELHLQGLRGPLCWGYYFSLTDKAPKPGEFKYLTQGALGLGDLLLSFTILTNEKESEVIREAKIMLRSARQESSPKDNKIVKKYRCGMLNFKMLVTLATAAGYDFKEIRDTPREYEIMLAGCNIVAKEEKDGIEVTLTSEDPKRGRELLDVLMKNAEEIETASPSIHFHK